MNAWIVYAMLSALCAAFVSIFGERVGFLHDTAIAMSGGRADLGDCSIGNR